MKDIFGNAVDYTDCLHDFIYKGVRDLFSYFENLDVSIEIKEISQDKKSMKILVIRRILVGNLSNDIKSTHSLRVQLTPTATLSGTVPKLYDIESAETSEKSLADRPEKDIIFSGIDLTSSIDQMCPVFEIPCGKFRWYKMAYESWEDISIDNEIYEITQMRYLRNMEITVANSTDYVIKFLSNSPEAREFTLNKRAKEIIAPSITDNSDTRILGLEVIEIN